jgi:hypothetical protein
VEVSFAFALVFSCCRRIDPNKLNIVPRKGLRMSTPAFSTHCCIAGLLYAVSSLHERRIARALGKWARDVHQD